MTDPFAEIATVEYADRVLQELYTACDQLLQQAVGLDKALDATAFLFVGTPFPWLSDLTSIQDDVWRAINGIIWQSLEAEGRSILRATAQELFDTPQLQLLPEKETDSVLAADVAARLAMPITTPAAWVRLVEELETLRCYLPHTQPNTTYQHLYDLWRALPAALKSQPLAHKHRAAENRRRRGIGVG